MNVEQDVRKVFERLPEVFVPERAGNLKATIQVELSGEGAGSWIIKIDKGAIAVDEGQAPSPDMTLQMQAKDYLNLTMGKINPILLFKDGKIKMQGDMGLAMRFPLIFDRSRAKK